MTLHFAALCLSLTCLLLSSAMLASRLSGYSLRDLVAISCLLFFFYLYVIPLTAGMFSEISAKTYIVSAVTILLISLVNTQRIRKVEWTQFGARASQPRASVNLVLSPMQAAVYAVLFVVLLLVYVPLILRYVTIHPLSWDVVWFELPNAIHFWQVGTLWRLDPGFGVSYPYGYELSIIWPIVFMKSEALIGLMHWLYTIAVVAYLLLILSLFVHKVGKGWKGIIYLGAVIALGGMPHFRCVFEWVGKNDIAVTAFGLAALYFFLRYVTTRRRLYLFGVGSSLGLMMGCKPTGVLYLLLFICLDLSLYALGQVQRRFLSLLWDLPLLALPAALIGGFWYVRNWILFRSFFDQGLAQIGWERSILASILQLAFRRLDWPLFIFAICSLLSVTLIAVFLVRYLRGHKDVSLYVSLSAAFAGSIVILSVTPFGTWPPGTSLQLRYSGIMIPTLIIFASVGVWHLLRLVQTRHSVDIHLAISYPLWNWASTPWLSASVSLVFALGLSTVMYAQQRVYLPPQGLPGYERVIPQFEEETGVYRWVYNNVQNASLLSLAVAPYGLLGSDFSNRVVYLTHPEAISLGTVLDIIGSYQVDYVLVGRNPHFEQETAGQFPPVLEEITDDGIFMEVYEDSQVVVYRIRPDCLLTFESAWYDIEHSGAGWLRWTDGRGQISVMARQDMSAILSGDINSIQRPNQVDILLNGERIETLSVNWGEWAFRPFGPLRLPLKAGENTIEFVSHNTAITIPTDSRPLAIAVRNLHLQAEGGQICELQP